MLLDDLRELKRGPRELRRFGLLVGAVFAALGSIWLMRGKPHFMYLLGPGAVLVLAGALAPRTLRGVYVVWMAFALALGFVVSHVLLTLFFFLVITPVGLVARLLGKDFLRLRIKRGAATYWLPSQRQTKRAASDYEKQF
jgi:hypothetical protein